MSVETASGPTRSASAFEPLMAMPSLPRTWTSLGRAFLDTCRTRPRAPAIADSTGAELTYGHARLRALALGRALSRVVGDSEYVGILLPPTVPACLTNIALTLWDKTPVNLNYTGNQAAIDSALEQTGLTHVLTSKKLLDKIPIRPKCELVLLEEVARQIRPLDKLWAAVAAHAPLALQGRLLPGLTREDPERTATVIFTSGSTGMPKGVVLTHRNILANSRQIEHHVELNPRDVILGILPFFHSFGYTVPLWTVLCVGLKAVYHVSPLDARVVGEIARKHRATILLATPTFLNSYLKRCDSEDFSHLRLLITGAEKLKPELAERVRETWGITPLEGYGCTETGPVVSVNTPGEHRTSDGRMVAGNKVGTVGTPMAGTAIKTVHPETLVDLPPLSEGVIRVKGPQVMAGYLNQPEATAEVLQDGWYHTGDIGAMDEDGFLTITGRLSRFSKIGGEMVPHQALEAAIHEAVGAEEPIAAVTAIPDSKRGERLVVVHTSDLTLEPSEVIQRLRAASVPNLWLPGSDSFLQVEELPVLGSGKLDLQKLRAIALERFAA